MTEDTKEEVREPPEAPEETDHECDHPADHEKCNYPACLPGVQAAAQGYAMGMHSMPMMTEHADISTGNRRRRWPGAPNHLTNSASQSQMEAPLAAAASYVNEYYVFELSETRS